MKKNITNQTMHAISASRNTGYYRFIFILILTILAKVAWGQSFGSGIVLSIPTVGKHIKAMATADFNGDGKADIAAISEFDHTMEIILSKSGGGYAPSKMFKVVNAPTAIITGDFNGDHKPDIIVSLGGSSEVKVFLNANGTFSAANYIDTPTGPFPSALAVSDFNGDGRLDVVVTEEGNDRVRVMLGTGLGDFLPPNFYKVGDQPRSIAIADYNSDGKPDIAVANIGSGEISTLINKGILGFYPAVNMNTGRKISKIVSADFNGDTYPDLAVANMFASSITVILCNKYGTFMSYTEYPVGNGPTSMTVGDFDSDGAIDLAVGNFFSSDVSVLMNKGAGLFGPSKTSQSGYASVWDVMSCDASQDGLIDVLLTTSNNEIKGLRQDEAKSNTPPYEIKPMPGQSATLLKSFSYTVPTGYFGDAETPNSLTYSFSNLPAGISFVAPATISGTLKGSAGAFECKIKVVDPQGQGIERNFSFSVLPTGVRPSNPSGIIPTRPNSRIAAEEPEQAFFDATSYPNPVDKELIVDIAGSAGQKVRVILMDISGRTLSDKVLFPTNSAHRESMDMSQNQRGIYLLQVSTSTQTKTVRVMKR
jgi:hypothetical protein